MKSCSIRNYTAGHIAATFCLEAIQSRTDGVIFKYPGAARAGLVGALDSKSIRIQEDSSNPGAH